VIRLGRSEAINANVIDVTLEELVNAKLNMASKKHGGDDIHKFIAAHKATSEELNNLRNQVDELKASGKPVASDQDRQFEVLKRRKLQLSNQIDAARDNGDVVARDAELSRRRVQQEILDGAHVICSTLSGSGHEMFQGLSIEFETVVIDEAAQSIELSALIPLKYGCSKCILVGDPKQLPPTVLSREAARFQYEQSLFVRMQRNHSDDIHLLDTQYRMHPEISVFPSKTFYDARLLDGPGMAKLRTRPWHQSKVLGPYRFFDVQGHHQSAPRSHSLINLAEIEIALKLFHRLVTDCKGYDFRGKVGIITPYKSQLRELKTRFAQRYGDSVFATAEFNTTDAFQGRESEIIIFSCVRASLNKGIGFLSDIRRMNVGITRAKCSLWVLGNSQSLTQGEFWGRLIQDAKTRDRYTSGNLNDVLSRPLLSLDSTTPASVSKASPLTRASSSDSHDIDMPDAPIFRDSTPASSRRSSTIADNFKDTGLLEEAQRIGYHPAGGGNGLNSNSNCQKCGSFAHYTNACDNPHAKAQTGPKCFRCNGDGHTKAFCTIDRCMTCGGFGHTPKSCTSTKLLSNKDKLRIGKQKSEHNVFLQRAPEMHRKRQLGDHDRQVPIVCSTSSTPPPSNANKRVSDQIARFGEKRRRGSSPPAGPLNFKAPKILKGAREADRQKPDKASKDNKHPLSNRPNGGPSRDRLESSAQNTVPPRPANRESMSTAPNNLGAIANARQADKREENSRDVIRPAALAPRPASRGSSSSNPNEIPLNRRQSEDRSWGDNRPWNDPSTRQADGYGHRQTDSYRPGQGTSAGQASGDNIPKRDGDGGGNGTSTIIKAGEGPRVNLPPRPPPPQSNVRMPKRKKEADPFIRPKKRP